MELGKSEELSQEIEKVRALYQASEDLTDVDDDKSYEFFHQAELAGEQLGLSDMDMRRLIASTIRDPKSRAIYTKLHIENPALPGENIFEHAERVFGEESTSGFKAAIKRWRAQKALGYPPDYEPGFE